MAIEFQITIRRGDPDDGFLTMAVDSSESVAFGRLGGEPLTVQTGGRSADNQDGCDAAFKP